MGQDQDPYDAGPFTPYQPAATPPGEIDGEDAASYAAGPVATPRRASAMPWLVGIGVLVLVIGAAVAGVVAFVGDDAGPGSDEVYVNDLEVGQCLTGGGFATDEPVSGLAIVDCSIPHDAQVLATKTLSGREAETYEFDNTEQIDAYCSKRFSQKDERLLEREDLTLIAFTETEFPASGDKVACLLANVDGSPLEGDLRDEMPLPG